MTAVEGTAGDDARVWRLRGGSVPLRSPVVMGVLNVTPDSFSDGGRHADPAAALDAAQRMAEAGAAMVDLGGESTRPGAREIPAAEELARVLPVLRLLKARLGVPVSVDTRRAAVARAVLDDGADAINDVSALADAEMAGVVAAAGAGLVLMHMRGTPASMQDDPRYDDVVGEVRAALRAARAAARAAGVEADRIVVDPGIGFGKTAEHNWTLLRRLDEIAGDGAPLLLGVSRKAFLGRLLDGRGADGRDVATAAVCALCWARGASVFRVHDVRAACDALRVAEALTAPDAAMHAA